MSHALKKALPFVIALLVGVGLSHFKNSLLPVPSRSEPTATVVPVRIKAIPDGQFSLAAKNSNGVYAVVKLQAVLGADGKVSDVKPVLMISHGGDESVFLSKHPETTSSQVSGKFVKELPFGLTESAISQIKRMSFSPKLVNGHLLSERVSVIAEFSYNESEWAHNCNSIRFTIFSDGDVLWRGETWVGRNLGCIMI